MKRAVLEALREHKARGEAVVLVTHLADGSQGLVLPWGEGDDRPAVDGALLATVQDAARFDRSGRETLDGEAVFLKVYNPPLRLVLVGAVHIAQVLAPMASLVGFQVSVIDPRRAWA